MIHGSCDPSCEAVVVDKRIWIDTIRDVKPGEELTYDGELRLETRHTPAAKRLYPCRCGSRRCRGTMLVREVAAPGAESWQSARKERGHAGRVRRECQPYLPRPRAGRGFRRCPPAA